MSPGPSTPTSPPRGWHPPPLLPPPSPRSSPSSSTGRDLTEGATLSHRPPLHRRRRSRRHLVVSSSCSGSVPRSDVHGEIRCPVNFRSVEPGSHLCNQRTYSLSPTRGIMIISKDLFLLGDQDYLRLPKDEKRLVRPSTTNNIRSDLNTSLREMRYPRLPASSG